MPVAPLPELGHRRGQQGEQPRLVAGVADHGVGQAVVEHEPRGCRGSLHGPTHLRGRHRADEHGAVADEGPQGVVVGELAHEVRTHRDDDAHRGPRVGREVGEGVEELGALGLARADRPHLLELVHDDDGAPLVLPGCRDEVRQQVGHVIAPRRPERTAGELAQGMRARPQAHDPPAAAAREHVRGQRGQQAGLQCRGLPRARRPDQGEQAAAGQPGHELGDEPLTAREPAGVLHGIRGEAAPRADAGVRRLRGRCGVAQLGDAVDEFGSRAGQFSARRSGECRCGADAVHREVAGGVDGGPVHRPGPATGACMDRLGDTLGLLRRQVVGEHPAHLGCCQRGELDEVDAVGHRAEVPAEPQGESRRGGAVGGRPRRRGRCGRRRAARGCRRPGLRRPSPRRWVGSAGAEPADR